MSSSDALHPQQLQMFIPAGELIAMRPSDSVGYGHTDEDLWSQKLDESKRWGVEGRESGLRPSMRTAPWSEYHKETWPAYDMDDDRSMHGSIAAEGVKEPVTVAHSTLGRRNLPGERIYEGHHRVAASADIDPKMEVPVVHR